MKNAPLTKRILIAMVALTILVFASYGYAYFAIHKNTATLVALANTAAEDQSKDQTLHTIKNSLATNSDFIGEINSFFVPPDGVVSFINTIEGLGKSANLSLSVGSVDVADSSATDLKQPLHMQIETEGSWKNSYYFLASLENLPYVITVNQVSFTLSSGGEGIMYKGGTIPRTPGSDETWKAAYDITVLQLKHS